MFGVGARLAGKAMNHLGYAGDLCLLAMSSKDMQTLLQICEECATEHDIIYNGAKSVCILFGPKGFRSPVAYLFLAGNRLLYVNSHSYLGVMIEVGKCEVDIKRQLMKFYANANTLIRVFDKYSNDVKIKLFHTYCTTLYCGIFGMKLQCQILVD